MAVIIAVVPNPRVYLRTHLYGLGRAETDAAYRQNLRVIAAILFAYWADSAPDLSGERGHIFDVVTSDKFYHDGVNTTSDRRLWFCSYVGFEKITSTWAKQNAPSCKGYLSMRIYITDEFSRELAAHTIQIYF